MKRVIAFLGSLRPDATPASYLYGDNEYKGTVFPEALRQFIDFDRMSVFVTEVARHTSLPYLERLADPRIEAIDIPDGRTSEERWLIFEKLLSVVEDGDRLIFDITHAFRSIPFFVFLAIAFLKSARDDVIIERILYGELGQKGRPGPVIDLTEYLNLLDWMSATDQFVGSGNSSALVRLVRIAASSGKDAPADRLKLRRFATSLDDVSQSLRLAIPDKAMLGGYRLRDSLDQARASMQHHLRPFLPLARRVEKAFSDIALPDPRSPAGVWRTLAVERHIISWYLDRQLMLQAITLAFEWLLSYGIACLGYTNLYDGKQVRQPVKAHYTAWNKARKTPTRKLTARDREKADVAEQALKGIPDLERLLDLYEQTSQIRNDLLHASKTVSEERINRTPGEWEADIEWVCSQLASFPLME
jgi:CRISPR-associated DxTHG motif protein